MATDIVTVGVGSIEVMGERPGKNVVNASMRPAQISSIAGIAGSCKDPSRQFHR